MYFLCVFYIQHIEIYYNRIGCYWANGWVLLQQCEQQYYQNSKIIDIGTV